jgi:hypothetical protein
MPLSCLSVFGSNPSPTHTKVSINTLVQSIDALSSGLIAMYCIQVRRMQTNWLLWRRYNLIRTETTPVYQLTAVIVKRNLLATLIVAVLSVAVLVN